MGGADTIMVFTSCPDQAAAEQLAATLLADRCAACITLIAGVKSIYRWRGSVETAHETVLLIKTAASCYDRLEAAIRGAHSYELPEILAVPVQRGLPEYLQWITENTRA